MDELSSQILRELLPVEKEVAPASKKSRSRKNEPPHADHWSQPILLERAAYLRELARYGAGEASETLREYPQHAAMLSFRARSGEAELHAAHADLFYVLSGSTILVTGGKIIGARTIGPGEVRGDSVEGGTPMELKQGDVAHVPAGTPHQMLLAGEKTVTCFVMKIQEAPTA